MLPRVVLIAAVAVALDGQTRSARDSIQMTDQITTVVSAFKGLMGVAAKDLVTGEEILVNADLRFPTASAIKTAVMVEAYHQAAEGKLGLDAQVTLRNADKVGGTGVLNGLRDGLALTIGDLLHLMIVVSDNTATNVSTAVSDGEINKIGSFLWYGLIFLQIFQH